jgi:murein DD-endopeptidase MepM/ murein hydrolase activator NlpD
MLPWSFRLSAVAIALILWSPRYLPAQQPQGPFHEHFDFKQVGPPITEGIRKEINEMLDENKRRLVERDVRMVKEGAAAVSLEWPLRSADGVNDPGYHGVSGFVDHNQSYPSQLSDYDCGTRTYDLDSGYNHDGTDYFTWPFKWHKMENNEVLVVASAPGTIMGRTDGNYDRNCSFGGGGWNAVYIQHSDGTVAWYGHMKNGSVTSKQVGDSVSAGEYLGVIGSSGNSTGPHLHFELQDDQGNILDPYSGSCSQPATMWANQPPYYDSAINLLKTHSAPAVFNSCPQAAVINEQTLFDPGDRIYFYTYYRDQLAEQSSLYTIFEPDETVYSQWTGSSSEPHYAASYWYWYFDFPQEVPEGIWRFQVIFQGETYTHQFGVGFDDSDGDWVQDSSDNCPDTANTDQADTDSDGVGSVCDNCPDTANTDQADADTPPDGTGDVCDDGDADGDGISDLLEVLCGSDPVDPGSRCRVGLPGLLLLLE